MNIQPSPTSKGVEDSITITAKSTENSEIIRSLSIWPWWNLEILHRHILGIFWQMGNQAVSIVSWNSLVIVKMFSLWCPSSTCNFVLVWHGIIAFWWFSVSIYSVQLLESDGISGVWLFWRSYQMKISSNFFASINNSVLWLTGYNQWYAEYLHVSVYFEEILRYGLSYLIFIFTYYRDFLKSQWQSTIIWS